MKSIIALAVASALLASSAGLASAADLPARTYTKAPAVVPPPAYDWSGFYIGLNGGGGSSRKCWDINNDFGTPVVPLREGCHDATGGLAGGQVGYRWQSMSWVFGVEAQGDWANLKGSNVSQFFTPTGIAANQSKVDAIGLFTGQVGYAWNNVLAYVKGGAAVTSDKYNGFIPATAVVFDTASETRWGGVVGAGLEIGFGRNWSVAFEYDHLFMGSRNVSFGTTIPVGFLSRIDNIKQDVDMGTVRVNYRWGGPVVAKY